MRHPRHPLSFLSFALMVHTLGCVASDDGPSEPPNYAAAFPQDRVATLTLTIAPADWDAMLADMTTLAGEFGSGGMGMGMMGMGMTTPPELIEACAGLAVDEPCMAALEGMTIEGTCTALEGMILCLPAGSMMGGMGGPGGPGGADIFAGTPIYVECTVEAEGQRWEHVGVRFKGNSSLSSAWSGGSFKLPLRLNFDHFEDRYPAIARQRFFGFEGMNLSNGWSDSSLVRERLGTEIFREFGLPAPATAFYRVYVDHGEGLEYFGLYTGIEIPDDEAFLDTNFGDHHGNLYKPEGEGATWATYDEATLGKENHEMEADFSDAAALFAALHADRSDGAAWRAELEARLEVDVFLRWLALNTVIQDWDTYGMMSHNYYLYADPNDGGRFHWIPWDHSFAFGGAGGLGSPLPLDLATVTSDWPLIRFLMDDPVYAARYRGFVEEAAALYSPEHMRDVFVRAHALVAPAVVGAEGETPEHTLLASPEDFETGHAELLSHVERRATEVADFLGP